MNILRLIQFLLLALAVAVAASLWMPELFSRSAKAPAAAVRPAKTHRHMIDKVGIIPAADVPRFEQYMNLIMRESGVDIRFVFVPDTAGQSIEMFAVEMMDELKIGGRAGQERGVLLLYDMQGQRLKLEVGYGLEGWFPDAFVSYLVQDHARLFFASGDLALGLRQMLRLLQHRLREAVIGNDFDPRALEQARALNHLSGGAGVSADVALDDSTAPATTAATIAEQVYPPGDSPADTYYRYLDWLTHWPLNANAEMFTPPSRSYMRSFRASPAYAEFILMGEYGKAFQIDERGDLALLYFTGTPFVSPHFFVRQNGRWYMDLAAEVRDTHEHVGGEYTWAYYGAGDAYTQEFGDLLTTIKGYRRIRDGDNRPLLIHGDA